MTTSAVLTTEKPEPLIIVGIGASAGGLEALRQLVPNLPNNKRVVYILAQHLDPKHSSMLGSILGRETAVSVNLLQQDQSLEGANLYLIPPGMDAYYADGHIFLEKALRPGPKPSIDRLLTSLADNHGENSIGIILSGTGMDGAQGIRAIKAAGGITIAQLASTARFDSMPHAAINTGHVDLILPPSDIAQQIQDLLNQPDPLFSIFSNPILSEEKIQEILRMILNQIGSDFRDYKRTTLVRRIERRMLVHKCKNLAEYNEFLKAKPEELYELHDDILISVTSFFRDAEAFQALQSMVEHILPSNTNNEVRIWAAGCATGEEAYSIAIMLCEHLGQHIERYKIQIFGTDLYESVLSIARQARYPKAAVTGITQDLLEKYFIQKDGNYQLIQTIRNMVLFARHDLVRDPPFSHLSLISCRNVLIYFNQNLQRSVLESFHYALKSNGILFLGKSETIGNMDNLFTIVERKARIYRRRSDVKGQLPNLLQNRHLREHYTAYQGTLSQKNRFKLQDILDKLLVEVYQTICILVDEHQEIVYVRGKVDPFLSFMEGRAALSVIELIRPELRHDLRGLLYKARRAEKTLVSRRISLQIYGEPVRITMRVHYFSAGKIIDYDSSLIIFEVHPAHKTHESTSTQITDLSRIKELEDELRETRESLQTTIEELETSNEELQSTYEEAQSTNEELYTSTEELQTSNEELQSTNEELRTVNQELSVKSSELEATNLQLKTTNEQLIYEINERKNIENRLEIERAKLNTIFQSQPNWINLCSIEGIIQEVNPAGLRIMQADHSEQLIGRSLKEFVLPEYLALVEACFNSITVQGEAFKSDLKIKTLKGNLRWLEAHSVIIRFGQDELRIMSIIVDHTEHKLAQELLAERQQELSHIMRLNTLGEMASGIAHELNQPLSAIANYLRGCERRMQANECSLEEITEVMRLVNIQVRRAGDILRYAKDFTRKDQNLERNLYDINEVIRETLTLLETTEHFKEIKWIIELDNNLGNVHINKIQIEQVLINMIQNAVDSILEANHNQQSIIRIRTQAIDKHSLKVLISDEGIGLSDGTIEQIFRPFYTSKKNGMGMGLSISRSIIEAHGGKLTGENNRLKGATFSFTLPIGGMERS